MKQEIKLYIILTDNRSIITGPLTHSVGARLHHVPKKGDTKLMAVTLSFLNRFSKFFH